MNNNEIVKAMGTVIMRQSIYICLSFNARDTDSHSEEDHSIVGILGEIDIDEIYFAEG